MYSAVIDEKEKETLSEHETQLASIRWHLSEGKSFTHSHSVSLHEVCLSYCVHANHFFFNNTGGFQEFKVLERLGEGNKPTAIIGEVADEMNMDLVVMSMEAVHSKHVDANLLAEFVPCPVLLLPL